MAGVRTYDEDNDGLDAQSDRMAQRPGGGEELDDEAFAEAMDGIRSGSVRRSITVFQNGGDAA